MANRRNFTNQFKAKVALDALRGDKTVQEITAKHQLHPNQVSTWKRQAIDSMADVFSGGKQSGPTKAAIKYIHAKIGRLAVENGGARQMEDIYAIVRDGTPIRIAAAKPVPESTLKMVARRLQFWRN